MSKIIAIVMVAIVAVLWIYNVIYQPVVEGRWLWVVTFVAAVLFWMSLRSAARRKADSIDYRRK